MKKKKLSATIRALHRDVGMFVLALTLIFSLSGAVLLFRTSDFLQVERQKKVQLESGLTPIELKERLKLRRFELRGDDAEAIVFRGGHYDKKTGEAVLGGAEYEGVVRALTRLHTSNSKNPIAWLLALYGLALAFLAGSGLFMFPKQHKNTRRGLIFAGAGTALAVTLVFLS